MAKVAEIISATPIRVVQANHKYTKDEVLGMTKVELKELVASGALDNSDADVVLAAAMRLATASGKPEKKPIVAVRTFTKDGKKGVAGTTVDMHIDNVRNVLMVQAARIHKDVVLQAGQVELWIKDIMDGKVFEASYYTISKK